MTGKREGWRLRRLLLELGTVGFGALDFRHRHVELSSQSLPCHDKPCRAS